ncbi:HNH endonuclease [Nocardiopsis alba]|uniref:HNH endonuclease n=1 Tax=Nocardiopsis alba TaxID=53437 RepID=UPI00382BA0B5
MKAYVGITDTRWYEFLAERPHLTEINFWRPSSNTSFKRIGTGDLFLFKSRYPHNRIVGGAVFSRFAQVPLSQAWEAFGEGNGRAGLNELREALNTYRTKEGKPAIASGEDPVIGCLMLRDPVFFPEGRTLAPPPDFPGNLVQGKGYDDILRGEHSSYFTEAVDRVLAADDRSPLDDEPHATATWAHTGPTRGGHALVRRRLGQEAFKLALVDAYRGRCAVTGTDVPPTLEAAHIHPVGKGGLHRLDNGLLLRADVHKLFDAGYLTITPESKIRVSPLLRSHHFSAAEYYTSLEGATISLPSRREDHPSKDALSWHEEQVFRAL